MNAIDFNAISKAYNTLQGKWGPFAIATLITFVLLVIPVIIIMILYLPVMAIGTAVFGDAGFLVTMPLMLLTPILMFAAYFPAVAGLLNMCLRTLDGEAPTTEHLMEVLKRPVPFIIAGVISGIIVGIGYVLCYLPGLVASGLLMFTVPIMLVEKMAPVDAVKASIDRLKPHWLMATLFALVIGFIANVGSYACLVGALFTVPIAVMSLAVCYRDFHSAPAAAPEAPEAPVS